jgi:glycolate oxidase
MVKEAVDFEMEAMRTLCAQNGGKDIVLSYDEKERAAIFAGRKKLFPALSRYREKFASTSLADDMAVPYSRMAETARKIHDVAERHHIVMTAYGHCGSGCMHTKILMDTSDPKQWQEARAAVEEIYEHVRSVGGTTSAEHGIGLSKAGAFQQEKADSLELLRAVKRAFDPNNILNPHKMMDAPPDWLSSAPLRYVPRSEP